MNKILLIVVVAFSSCLHRGDKIEYEQGVVISKSVTPAYYNRYTTYDRVYVGRSYKGYQHYITVPRTHSDYVPPVYTTTFKCQHQKVFGINREDIYDSLNTLDTVTIEFYNMLDGDGITKDYDFITAYKQKR